MKESDIGVIGLAVMGENLVLNIESKGYKVSVFNRNPHVTEKFAKSRACGKEIFPFYSLREFTGSLKSPRKILMMVRAGEAVDQVIESLLPFLSEGDILIDGGNSNHSDTARRLLRVEKKGIMYVGSGISGGEEGALNGPSLMPGGSFPAWPHIEKIFSDISAKAKDGSPCSAWIGPSGSGHFVKMVHNGIEYADMQIISEGYSILKNLSGMDNDTVSELFEEWNKAELESYLTEITYKILRHRENNGDYLIDKIVDAAGQKGTGKWSVINAMELGLPLGLIATALFERSISSERELRKKAARLYNRENKLSGITDSSQIKMALYASKIISYSQGFSLLTKASEEWNWNLDLSSVARIWRNGCIIRSSFLDHIAKVYESEREIPNMLLSEYFRNELQRALPSFRKVVSAASEAGIPVPALSSALNYFHSLTSEKLPTNLIQAQRDFFGAHSFERIDRPRGEFFHENWTGIGGDSKSGRYNA